MIEPVTPYGFEPYDSNSIQPGSLWAPANPKPWEWLGTPEWPATFIVRATYKHKLHPYYLVFCETEDHRPSVFAKTLFLRDFYKLMDYYYDD